MITHITIVGYLLIALALMHLAFRNYFNWDKELKLLSLINRQMMTIHTFFIAVVVFLMGLLCITSANELMETALGKKIAIGFSIFWFLRLFIQFFGYSAELWKGKTFETFLHVLFSILWLYFSVVFLKVVIG